jgi:hypothetical protein
MLVLTSSFSRRNIILYTELDNTPKMMEMEDEDQIDCMIEQVGGTTSLEQL